MISWGENCCPARDLFIPCAIPGCSPQDEGPRLLQSYSVIQEGGAGLSHLPEKPSTSVRHLAANPQATDVKTSPTPAAQHNTTFCPLWLPARSVPPTLYLTSSHRSLPPLKVAQPCPSPGSGTAAPLCSSLRTPKMHSTFPTWIGVGLARWK